MSKKSDKIPNKKFHFPSVEVMLLHTKQLTDKSNNAIRFATVSRKKKSFCFHRATATSEPGPSHY
jgi:hypothetical protein